MLLFRLIAAFFIFTTACPAFSQTYETRTYSIADGLPSNLISCAEQDRNGLMWFGTWRGLCCFDGYEFLSFNNIGDENERPMCSRLSSIKPDRQGNIWCITYDRRAYKFNSTECSWTDISAVMERRFKKNFRVRNIYPIESGVVWITCYDGDDLTVRIADAEKPEEMTDEFSKMESRRNKAEKELWTKYKQAPMDVSHIPGLSTARKYKVDAQGSIWHLDNQLTRITPRQSGFDINPLSSFAPNQNSRATRTIPALPDMDGKQVYAALTDSKGRQWLGTKGGGLYMNGKKVQIKGKDVYDIFEDSRHQIWVACYDEGFNLISNEETINPDNRLKNYPKERFAKVRHITETKDGIIFLSTADGIVCFSNNFKKPEDIVFHTYTQSRDNRESLPGGNVMQVLQAKNGRIYISTMTGGLMTIKSGDPLKDNLAFEPVQETQRTEGIVLCMAEDDGGNLWLARENYLQKYDPKTGETVVFGRKDFGQEILFSEALPVISQLPSAISHQSSVSPKGQTLITFGTLGGTLSFNPNRLVKSNLNPRILFSSLQFQGSQDRLPILNTEELDIPADQRDLTIFFSALDYQDNELIQYAYKIVEASENSENSELSENSDGDSFWNYVGRAHCASFNNLPCGHLRLLVKSTNADGVWTDNITELRIYSHPTFWETPWAWLLYLTIILAIVAVAVYIVQMRNRHRREREEMERKLETLLASLEKSAELNEPSANSQQPSSSGKAQTYVLKEVEIDSEEKKFMERLMAFLNDNIGDSELKIGDIADALHMSRTVFYDRLKTITGMPPVDFVRFLRIQRAKQMLQSTDLTVSQIAYETGFSEPNYFSKVFKSATGISPIGFRKSAQKQSGD